MFWWKRHEQSENLNRLPKAGRPSVFSVEQENDIIERITENPFLTAVSFARELNVCVTTISSLFRRHGLKCRTATHETHLRESHRINRIAFCQALLEEWDEDRLASVIFSNERTFCTDTTWRKNFYRSYNSRYDPHCVKEETKNEYIENTYWGAIGCDGPVTPIVRIEGPFDSRKYETIIRTHVIPMMDKFNDEGKARIFMQDNSPPYTAADVMALFSEQSFDLMDWPPLSPDLNPIENVWSYIESNCSKTPPKNEANFNSTLEEHWNALVTNRRKFYFLERTRSCKIF